MRVAEGWKAKVSAILLNLTFGEAHAAPAQASTKEEWAQEARKLELQGKEE